MECVHVPDVESIEIDGDKDEFFAICGLCGDYLSAKWSTVLRVLRHTPYEEAMKEIEEGREPNLPYE